MKVVSTEELINYKILPYNIYSEFGEKLFTAGEVLTPGKLLQLKHMDLLYRDDESQFTEAEISRNFAADSIDEVITQSDYDSDFVPEEEYENKPQAEIKYEVQASPVEEKNVVVEVFDMTPKRIQRNKFSVDDIDILNYRGPINKKSTIDPQTQLKIKAFYTKIISMMEERPLMEMLGMFANVRDKIVQDVLSESNDVLLSSQLKLLGEYTKCHALNTAILSGAVAKKMEMSENQVYDIVLAGLLHDIGKSRMPLELLNKGNLTSQEQKALQDHPKIGYKIIKIEMDLPESIARVALDHHEHNDGSGYPNGTSGDKISLESKIVSVCNYFDNLTSNRTHHQVKNTKDALKVMLEQGTPRFSAEALYTFIHMFSYNDIVNFEEMLL